MVAFVAEGAVAGETHCFDGDFFVRGSGVEPDCFGTTAGESGGARGGRATIGEGRVAAIATAEGRRTLDTNALKSSFNWFREGDVAERMLLALRRLELLFKLQDTFL